MKELPTLAEFRVMRDQFQKERQAIALPILRARQLRLCMRLAVMKRRHSRASKRNKELIENGMRPLQFEYQEVCGQIAMIESNSIAR